MFDIDEITSNYLDKLIAFLHSVSLIYKTVNTQFIKENILTDPKNSDLITLIQLINSVDLNEFVSLQQPQINHPQELQKLIESVNYFRISYEIINTDHWKCKNQQRKMRIKKVIN